jgi:CubicO group peptidase (beta-lactamase class C family)
MRIGSVSKTVTAVCILKLIELRVLTDIETKIFGPGSILGAKFDKDKGPYPALDEITIDHLLSHTSGGWPNDPTDPFSSHSE